MARPQEILVIGAGIGGLSAALALARLAGARVRVFERAPALRAVGAGITVQSNAMRVFARLGVADQIRTAGVHIQRGVIRDERGRAHGHTDMAALGTRFGAPSVGIHRARLIEILAESATTAGVVVETGRTLAAIEDGPDHITACFADGSRVRGRALIGADGIWSRARVALHGEQPTRYSGTTCWRGLAQCSLPPHLTETWGPGLRFGGVPIGADCYYWFAVADAPQGEADEGPVQPKLQRLFAGFPDDVRRALAHTEEEAIVRHDLIDRPPERRWGQGRLTLLGDAAHAMTPNMGQGACQAIEDALALAEAVAAGGPMEAALRAYEDARRDRALWFVERSWQFGQFVHALRATPLRRMRDRLIAWTAPLTMERQFQQIYGAG